MSTAPDLSYHFPVVALTPQEAKAWVETRTAFLWHCPAFAHILYKLMNPRGQKEIALFTEAVPIAATDGTNLIINPRTFFKDYDLNERIFIVAHEIAHNIFNHCGTGWQLRRTNRVAYADGKVLDYNHELMNYAQDFVINATLVESKVGSMPKDACFDAQRFTSKTTALDAYRVLYKDQKPQGGGGMPGQKPGGGQGQGMPNGKRFDQHLPPGAGSGKDAGQAQSDRNDQQWRTEVAAAAASAKAQGKLPAGLERLLIEVLEPQIDWRDHIRSLIHRKVGNDSYDWRRLDRRLIVRGIGAPGRTGFGAGTVVVGGDTSGSVDDKTTAMFMAEVAGILSDVQPERLIIVWCDAKVQRVEEMADVSDLMQARPKGGGGTDFRPVFDWIKEEGVEPDALIYMTDGMGSFPKHAPDYPVIWGNITPDYKYPFGDVVFIPKQV